MDARKIEIMVAEWFDYRVHAVVPNVHWGLGLSYEMDMAVVTKSRYLIEVEIKTSASDIKADLKKKHQHDSRLVKCLYFAVPEKLKDNPDIPLRAGILSCGNRVECIRPPIYNKTPVKLTDEKYTHLLELGCMRIWSLKLKLSELQNKFKEVKAK